MDSRPRSTGCEQFGHKICDSEHPPCAGLCLARVDWRGVGHQTLAIILPQPGVSSPWIALVLSVLLLSAGISFQYLLLYRISLAAQQSPVKKSSKSLVPTAQRININQATLAELTTLPGIGPVIAGRIVDYRKNNPPFRKVEELLIIKGISKDRLDRIRNRISLE